MAILQTEVLTSESSPINDKGELYNWRAYYICTPDYLKNQKKNL